MKNVYESYADYPTIGDFAYVLIIDKQTLYLISSLYVKKDDPMSHSIFVTISSQ